MARRLNWRQLAALLLLAFALFRPGQYSLPPIDRDEPRYAQSSAQMLETGDDLDVRFLDQPRYLQPAGIYWLQAAAVDLFGSPHKRLIGDHRLVSMVAAMLAVALTGAIGARLFGAWAGFLAGVLMASTGLLGFESRLATIDATLLAAVLAAQLALVSIWRERDAIGPPRRWPAAVFWVAIGAGMMLKGPVILLVVFGTLAALAVAGRGRAGWMRALHPAWGVPLAVLIVLPWLAAIGVVSHGAFFAKSVGGNFLGKVLRGQQAHGLPPGYHLALFPTMFGPGSLLALLVLPRIWARRREPEIVFLLCWIVPTWVVFEAIATKLPHYVLPVYPAIAILVAGMIVRPWNGAVRSWLRRLYAVFAGYWLVSGVFAAFAVPIALWWFERLILPLSWAAALAFSGLLWVLLREVRRGRIAAGRPGIAVACAAGVAFLSSWNAYREVLPRLGAIWISPRVAALVAASKPCPGSALYSSDFSEPSLAFLVGSGTRFPDLPETADRMIADPACAMALVGRQQLPAFLTRVTQGGAAPRRLGEVTGLNYSNGRRLDLILFGGKALGG